MIINNKIKIQEYKNMIILVWYGMAWHGMVWHGMARGAARGSHRARGSQRLVPYHAIPYHAMPYHTIPVLSYSYIIVFLSYYILSSCYIIIYLILFIAYCLLFTLRSSISDT